LRENIKKYRFFILTFFLLTGLSLGTSLIFDEKHGDAKQELDKKTQVASKETASSIPKPTILFLICIGMIGLLGIRRQNNNHHPHADDNSRPEYEDDKKVAQTDKQQT